MLTLLPQYFLHMYVFFTFATSASIVDSIVSWLLVYNPTSPTPSQSPVACSLPFTWLL